MATTPVCLIDATGIHMPAFNDVLTYLQNAYKGIYGSDIIIDNDSQDGQLLGIFASAINDANAMAVAVYNSFSPATALGAGLSSVVKINGIARNVSSFSSVDVQIIGQAGTTITNGIIADGDGNQWLIPTTVNIPPAGTITVTATASTTGALAAAANTVTNIVTPTLGWQSVTNALTAVPGAPVETDAALRQRQTTSTALPSNTILEGIIGGIAALNGVTRYAAYENDTDTTDGNGIPSHSIALVIEGGDAQTIAETIAAKKTPGSGTYGTTTETVIDNYGVSHSIKFSRPVLVPITVAISLRALNGYTTAVATEMQQAVVDYINGTAIGGGDASVVEWDGAMAASKSGSGSAAFRIASLTLSRASGAGTPDVPLAFDEAPSAVLANIVITVL